jgi:hypothetical protein
VQESAVHRTRIDKEAQSQLTDTIETLHIGVLQYLEEHPIRYAQETKHRVIDDFSGLCHMVVYFDAILRVELSVFY